MFIPAHYLRLLSLSLLILIAGCTDRTTQQTGSIYLQGCAKRIAIGAQNFHSRRGIWPSTLAEIVREENIAASDLRYPRLYDLPDRRNILTIQDNLEWIYIRPKDDLSMTPIVIAPIPFNSSMGKTLTRPKRIVVKLDSPPEAVDEDSLAALIRTLPKP